MDAIATLKANRLTIHITSPKGAGGFVPPSNDELVPHVEEIIALRIAGDEAGLIDHPRFEGWWQWHRP